MPRYVSTPNPGPSSNKMAGGTLERKDILSMPKLQLEALAKNHGIDLSNSNNNAERAEAIISVLLGED